MTKGGRRDHWCLQTSWAHRKGQNKMGNKIASRTFSRQRISCCPRAGKPEEDQTAFGETLPVLLSKTLHPMAFICTPTAPSYFSPVSPRPSLGSGHQIAAKVPRKTGGGFATVPTASEQKGQSTYVTARARGAPGTAAARHRGSSGVTASATGEAPAPTARSPGAPSEPHFHLPRPPPPAHSPQRLFPPGRRGTIESLEAGAAAGPACRGAGRGGTMGQDGPGRAAAAAASVPASCRAPGGRSAAHSPGMRLRLSRLRGGGCGLGRRLSEPESGDLAGEMLR